MASAGGVRRAGKGLSEAGVRGRFGAEEACRKALFEMRWREGLTCSACGGRGFCELKARKVFQCNRCCQMAQFAGSACPVGNLLRSKSGQILRIRQISVQIARKQPQSQ